MAKTELPNEVAVGRGEVGVTGHNGTRKTVALWLNGTELVFDHDHARELGRTLIEQADLVDAEQEDDE
jgi:hypothetical protein